MGVIGDAFKKLFALLWQIAQWFGDFISNAIQVIVDVIKFLIDLIVGLVAGLLYLIYMIGVLAVKLFLVLLEAGKMLWSLAQGFFRTLGSFTYSPSGSAGHGYSDTISKIVNAMEPLQLTPIAYICMAGVWVGTAVAAMKLISSIRVGGD